MYTPRENLQILQHDFSCEVQPRENLAKMHIREFGQIFVAKKLSKNRIKVLF